MDKLRNRKISCKQTTSFFFKNGIDHPSWNYLISGFLRTNRHLFRWYLPILANAQSFAVHWILVTRSKVVWVPALVPCVSQIKTVWVTRLLPCALQSKVVWRVSPSSRFSSFCCLVVPCARVQPRGDHWITRTAGPLGRYRTDALPVIDTGAYKTSKTRYMNLTTRGWFFPPLETIFY